MRSFWITAALIITVVSSVSISAGAAPPAATNPALESWFQNLLQPGTQLPCCSISDCRITTARDTDQGYEALIDGRWVAVPTERVLDRMANPTGHAVVCYRTFHDDDMQPLPVTIFCFIRPLQS
jgi:hypothetical protein